MKIPPEMEDAIVTEVQARMKGVLRGRAEQAEKERDAAIARAEKAEAEGDEARRRYCQYVADDWFEEASPPHSWALRAWGKEEADRLYPPEEEADA